MAMAHLEMGKQFMMHPHRPVTLSGAWLLAGSTLLALAIGVVGYLHVPPETPVTVHFGPAGVPNGWASPARAFFTLPVLCLGLLLLQLLIPKIKPSADRLERTIVTLVFGAAGLVLVAAQVYVFRHAV